MTLTFQFFLFSRYREQNDEESESNSDSENDEYFNYYGDDDGPSEKIDRLHYNENAKQKFKLNEDY